MWPDETYPMLFTVKLCPHAKLCPYAKFWSVAPISFLAKLSFLAFLIQKGVWPYRSAHDAPLVTLLLNRYGFVGLTSIV